MGFRIKWPSKLPFTPPEFSCRNPFLLAAFWEQVGRKFGVERKFMNFPGSDPNKPWNGELGKLLEQSVPDMINFTDVMTCRVGGGRYSVPLVLLRDFVKAHEFHALKPSKKNEKQLKGCKNKVFRAHLDCWWERTKKKMGEKEWEKKFGK